MSRFSSCLYLRERTRKPIAARRPRQIRLQPARPPLFAAGAPPDAPQRLQVRRVGGVRVHGRHGARSVARETPRALRRRAPPDPRTRGIAGVTAYLSPWRVPAFRRCARATTTLACRLRRRRRRQLRERCQKFVSGGASVHQSELARVGHRGGDIERRLRGGVHHQLRHPAGEARRLQRAPRSPEMLHARALLEADADPQHRIRRCQICRQRSVEGRRDEPLCRVCVKHHFWPKGSTTHARPRSRARGPVLDTRFPQSATWRWRAASCCGAKGAQLRRGERGGAAAALAHRIARAAVHFQRARLQRRQRAVQPVHIHGHVPQQAPGHHGTRNTARGAC